ncbi:REP-associated tyrosine transposase [Candidatus Bipolaricaulota sp. J31]
MDYKTFGRRRSLRLKDYNYSSPHPVHIIIGTHRARESLRGDGFLRELMRILEHLSAELGMRIYAYCFMPDHLHLLLSPGGKTDIIEFIRRFKGASTRCFWKYGGTGKLWQRGFYDHILRKEEDLMEVTEYILNNPVRAGLVETRRDYPYAGSFVFDL